MDLISNFAMPIICKNKKTVEKYKKRFINHGVEIRPIIAGNIEMQPFYKKYINKKTYCLNSNFIHQNGFYFANNPELNKKEINTIIGLLAK